MSTSVGAIMSDVGSVFSTGMTMAGTVGTTVASNPLLLIFVIIPLVGLGVGLFKRLLNV